MDAVLKIPTVLQQIGLEIDQNVYKGSKKEYIVYNIATETPTDFADNTPQYDEVYVQVHLFLPKDKNYLAYQQKIRHLLFEAEFGYPSVALNVVEDETRLSVWKPVSNRRLKSYGKHRIKYIYARKKR